RRRHRTRRRPVTRYAVVCGFAAALACGGGAAQTRAPLPHWVQLDDAHRKSLKTLLGQGYEMKAAFVNSYEQEIAYLENGASLYRCVVGGANLEALAPNELLCSEFTEPRHVQ